MSENARPGFHTIEGTVSITADADLETLEQLKAAVDAHCPVLDMLRGAHHAHACQDRLKDTALLSIDNTTLTLVKTG